jgi:hypothetical protein
MTTHPTVDHMSREICKICYHVNVVGFSVPDDVWEMVVPTHVRNAVVCLSCFTRLADEQLVEWDQMIEFFPVSMATRLALS